MKQEGGRAYDGLSDVVSFMGGWGGWSGCAPGWNAAMRYMAYREDVPWAIVLNSDIYAPPGMGLATTWLLLPHHLPRLAAARLGPAASLG